MLRKNPESDSGFIRTNASGYVPKRVLSSFGSAQSLPGHFESRVCFKRGGRVAFEDGIGEDGVSLGQGPRADRRLVAVASVTEDAELKRLWREFRKTNDKAIRDRLILTYAPLVKFVAGRLGSGLPAHLDANDLVSYGLLGLIGAIERFDPYRDVKFETYAVTRIKGAIIDELRAMDWVPRSVRARAREIERAMASLEAQLHRAPTDAEIADKIGITETELEESLTDIARSSIAALDEVWTSSNDDGDRLALIDTIEDTQATEPQTALDRMAIGDVLAVSIAALPEREKIVITLYYYEELTLREIGEVLGVSESRVSQLHTKAILRLRTHLSANREALPLRPRPAMASEARPGRRPRKEAKRARRSIRPALSRRTPRRRSSTVHAA
jgi:RNA polymerase sigma factor FliA